MIAHAALLSLVKRPGALIGLLLVVATTSMLAACLGRVQIRIFGAAAGNRIVFQIDLHKTGNQRKLLSNQTVFLMLDKAVIWMTLRNCA